MTATTLRFSNMNNAEAITNLVSLPVDFNLSGGVVVVPGVAAKSITVYRLFLVVGGNTNITIQDGPNNSQTGAMPMLANGSLFFDISNVPWFQTSSGNDFVINSSAAVQVSGKVDYQQG